MKENTFESPWLLERFRFDEAARNPTVDQHCIDFLSTADTLHLVDVGSGMGANFLHFFEKLPNDQQWYFVDHDEKLLAASLRRIATYAGDKGYAIEKKTEQLSLRLAGQHIQIQTIQGSFESIEQWVPLAKPHLVMASAFFDLFRADQLRGFMNKVLDNKAALLLTLNYAGMAFHPSSEEDRQIIQWYEGAYAKTPTGWSPLWARTAASTSVNTWNKISDLLFPVPAIGTSQGGEQVMTNFLLRFMESAIGELKLTELQEQVFHRWMKERRQLVQQGKLEMQVKHLDFFAPGRS